MKTLALGFFPARWGFARWGVQRVLGHDQPSATLDVYADLFDDDLDEVANRLIQREPVSLLRTLSAYRTGLDGW